MYVDQGMHGIWGAIGGAIAGAARSVGNAAGGFVRAATSSGAVRVVANVAKEAIPIAMQVYATNAQIKASRAQSQAQLPPEMPPADVPYVPPNSAVAPVPQIAPQQTLLPPVMVGGVNVTPFALMGGAALLAVALLRKR